MQWICSDKNKLQNELEEKHSDCGWKLSSKLGDEIQTIDLIDLNATFDAR